MMKPILPEELRMSVASACFRALVKRSILKMLMILRHHMLWKHKSGR